MSIYEEGFVKGREFERRRILKLINKWNKTEDIGIDFLLNEIEFEEKRRRNK